MAPCVRNAAGEGVCDASGHDWSRTEAAAATFADARLHRRFAGLLRQLAAGVGASIPQACGDWAGVKAAYRFLANGRVGEADILGGHFAATAERARACRGVVLLLQDTTEFTYRRASATAIGVTKSVNSGRDAEGRWRHHTLCGLLLHTSLAVTEDGVPLGVAAVKVWTRSKFKGTAALKRVINPTRVPIEGKESIRWLDSLRQSVELLGDPGRLVHVADRESDIYELFCLAGELGTHFVVRTCVDRLAGDGTRTVADEMAEARVRGLHRVELRGAAGEATRAVLEIRARRVHVLPPIGKQRRYPALDLTVLHVTERNPPRGRKPVEWKLLTGLPVRSRKEAVEKVRWYATRWKIETFHKILKSGCRAEESRLRSAERIANLLALFCIIAWRILWLSLAHRADPEAAPRTALTDREITLLDRLPPGAGGGGEAQGRTLATYVRKLARLGGHLGRARDPPPGIIVLWRGLSRLADIELGVEIVERSNCG
jgi:transposase-like protein/DDE family transposase